VGPRFSRAAPYDTVVSRTAFVGDRIRFKGSAIPSDTTGSTK